MDKQAENSVLCPWCNRGEVISEGNSSGEITIRCPKCFHFFRIHLDSMTAEKAIAHRKITITRGKSPGMQMRPVTKAAGYQTITD